VSLKRQSLAIFALIALVSCTRKPSAQEGPTAQRRADRSVVLSDAGAAYVRVEPVKATTTGRALSFAGKVTFDERHVARLGPAVGGRVGKVSVVTGDHVKKGDILVTLFAADVAAAQAQLAQARNAKGLAERNSERAKMLSREGAGTEAEVHNAEAALAQAKNEEERANAALSAMGGASGATEYILRSPIDGMVIERNATVGAQVNPTMDKPLITVGDLSTVWVVADVFEQDLAPVQVGADATIQILAIKDKKYEGKISYVTSVVDPTTRAAEARVELSNADNMLKPGMSARVLVQGKNTGGVELPSSALLARRDQFFVFVRQKDGSFMQREVQVGDQHGQHATVLNGLAPGDEVVTEGAILLDVEANEGY